ncbi:MAG TPA: SIR2 family protein [Solirubrobacteraceae bacterium]|jgi:hypothetical protein
MSAQQSPPLDLDFIADTVRKQECILFLGAGVHSPPPGRANDDHDCERYPRLGADLSRELAHLCGLSTRYPQEDPTNLARVATFFENQFSRHRLVLEITRKIQEDRQISPMLRALVELPFPLIITTNQDTLLESALLAAGKQPRLSIYNPESRTSDDPRNLAAESPIVYKLHGDITHPETVVVTEEDLLKFTMRMGENEQFNPAPSGLKYHLRRWTTLFVGYSLRDYNLRLLFTTLRWRIDNANLPDMYSVDPHPDPLVLEVWENKNRYVKFLAEDVWTFVPELYQRVLQKDCRYRERA